MRAASHWTWLAVLAALSRKAGLAQHDLPESGGMLFAELLHCVCIVIMWFTLFRYALY